MRHKPQLAPVRRLSHTILLLTVFFLNCIVTFAPPPTQAGSWPEGPTEAELQDILAILENYAVDRMHAEGVPGMAYAVVKDDQIIYARGFGVRRSGEPEPVDENTLFEIGSITKSFTSTLVAMLVDEGKLKWTDPVVKYLPDFAMHERWVTRVMQIEDILCHRSGMPDDQLDYMLYLGFEPSQIVRAIRWVQPVTSFRTAYAYSNSLYQVAGKLIQLKSGHGWKDELRERLLRPLGMNATTGDPDALSSANMAGGHMVLSDGSLWIIPNNWRYDYIVKNVGPAGGIVSNVVDMAQWLRFQLAGGSIDGRQLVSPENFTATHAPRTLMVSDGGTFSASYAMGWIYVTAAPLPYIMHNGDTPGMSSNLLYVPGADVGIVVLINAAAPSDDNLVLLPYEIATMFYQLYFYPNTGVNSDTAAATLPKTGLPAQTSIRSRMPISAGPLAAAQLDRYVNTNTQGGQVTLSHYAGAYENPAYGRITVEVQKNNLFLTMGPAELRSPLVHYQGNVFVGTFPDYPQEVQFPLQFILDHEDDVSGLVMPIFSDVDGGVFTKEE